MNNLIKAVGIGALGLGLAGCDPETTNEDCGRNVSSFSHVEDGACLPPGQESLEMMRGNCAGQVKANTIHGTRVRIWECMPKSWL